MGISQLGQGAYVAAMLTVGTGSAMTLVLIGTLAVGDLLAFCGVRPYILHEFTL
jgi:hypothetical protein